ncbi:MAG: ABC transporter substrate-binding protein [Pseudomonadota bacterium]
MPRGVGLLHFAIGGLTAAFVVLAGTAWAQTTKLTFRAAVMKLTPEPPLPISRLDDHGEDYGFAGGQQATADNATTGRFLGHAYETLEETAAPADALATFDRLAGEGVRVFVALAEAETLLALADHAAETVPDAIIFNAFARDDALRTEACRPNLFHTVPSRAMMTDSLAQYLIWKQWDEWLIVSGEHPGDRAMAAAMERSATKFGAEVVETRIFEDAEGMRTSDSGHVLVKRQIPTFMQDTPDHDIVLVADESELFGAYLPYRTWIARPVAGDAGLRARTWHPAHESWGATQLQRRFERAQDRRMYDLDYQVWVALRVIGEAVTRTNSADPAALAEYLVSDAFEVAAFKGQALTFRPWNQQLRQGVLLADGRTVITVSPLDEFLHQRTGLDTLGFDEPESGCSLN